ncbi:MAG: FAD-dependent oxidoreductase [Acetobacteraceae bacterium]|nr:FAD-dependent oxidoreductase [Acetobacteraceae bacterium]
MRTALSGFDGRNFDVVVVGGGAAGASASQHIAAAGYDTLLVDKGDFASGTSSRSSRLLYCGLAHLSPDYPLWRYAFHPRDLMRRLWMARLAMQCRAQLVQTMPERLTPHTFFFPVFKGAKYAGWKVDLAYRVLGRLGPSSVPLDYRRLSPAAAAEQFGLVRQFDQSRLDSVAVFTEYQYNWPERICLDTVFDAERCGATVRNYTRVTGLAQRPDGGWDIRLEDSEAHGQSATVHAKMLVNTAGPWVDRVNSQAKPQSRKRVVGIKGINVIIKLPDDCIGQGMETISSIDQPFYCMPWGRYHFLGPTETVFEDDPDDVRVLPEELDFILGEGNRVFPGLKLTRDHAVYSWAGVRPRTASADKDGVKALTIHDMATEGMKNALTLSGAPIMVHRQAGRELLKQVGARLKPSGNARILSYNAKLPPENTNSPPLDYAYSDVRVAHLRHAAENEHPRTLIDLLFRRVSLGWTGEMAQNSARDAAEAVAGILGWDEARVDAEVACYRRFIAEHFSPKPPAAGGQELLTADKAD